MGSHGGEDGGKTKTVHVAMFPFFAFGHISPFVQLSKKLATHGGARISFLSAPANIPRISDLLSPHADAVDLVPLQIPPVDGLPPEIQSTAEMTPAMAELVKKAMDLMQPQIRVLLSDLRPHVVVHDFSQPWLPSLASPLGIKTLFFSVFSAVSSAFLTVPSRRPLSSLLLESSRPDDDALRLMKLPPPGGFPDHALDSVPTYHAADFLYIFRSFFGGPCVYDRVVSCMTGSSAILIKSCMEMEGAYVRYLEGQYGKPVLLAGPLVPEPPTGELEGRWASWLGGFPEGSVIYCSFGSETFLTDEGIRELALGLELTGLPFLLVLNFPKGGGGGGGGRGRRDQEEKEEDASVKLRKKLPEDFGEKVRDRAVVHSGWVQQQHILAHPSVGYFLCHAGLSSLMEGLVNGCQLVMLPQRGDQYLNARLLGDDLRAGVEVSRREDGSFDREDVREAARKVMPAAGGDEEEPGTVRENHRKLREFLLDKERQNKFTEDFVAKLKDMACP